MSDLMPLGAVPRGVGHFELKSRKLTVLTPDRHGRHLLGLFGRALESRPVFVLNRELLEEAGVLGAAGHH
jgi:hypothetical protein